MVIIADTVAVEKLLDEIKEAIQEAKRKKVETDITIRVRPGLPDRWSETRHHTVALKKE
jgi:hypothetical protein